VWGFLAIAFKIDFNFVCLSIPFLAPMISNNPVSVINLLKLASMSGEFASTIRRASDPRAFHVLIRGARSLFHCFFGLGLSSHVLIVGGKSSPGHLFGLGLSIFLWQRRCTCCL
jgi:hypothetical protein